MSFSKFSLQAFIIFAILIAVVFGLSFLPKFSEFLTISWASPVFMLIVVHLSFLFMRKGMQSEKHREFMKFISLGFLIKLLLSALFIFLFKWIAEPGSNLFVIPFFFVYFIFTFLLVNAIKIRKTKT